jgi:CHAT domain-containing protein
VQGQVMDNLTASVLQLTGGTLSARDLIRPEGPWLGAELVFLNACRSAGFRMRLGGEVGGFWQAFLAAGVPSIVGTLFFVDPGHAQRIAVEFYRGWQTGGLTKAEALRRAQLAMAREGIEARHWASHVLIGDHL